MTVEMRNSAYEARGGLVFQSTPFTRGPWNAAHQHAGPPIALVCGAIEKAAAIDGFTHLARLTANLLRPIPVGLLAIEVASDYIGKNAAHYSARLFEASVYDLATSGRSDISAVNKSIAEPGLGKELARFTALLQRPQGVGLPEAFISALPGHPAAQAPAPHGASTPAQFPFADGQPGYAELVEIREARGTNFNGPCAVWFRLNHALVQGEAVSPYQRVAVAADSGNGISAVLDFRRDVFVNFDLTINLLRRPVGEWICLDAQTFLGEFGSGLAESRLFDERGLVGRATQSLMVRVAGSE
jgi:Thioesterase-like superfamily